MHAIFQFVSANRFRKNVQRFVTVLPAYIILLNHQRGLLDPKWKRAMHEEMEASGGNGGFGVS